ncbi:MAG: UDP-N-acetylmuramoyl-L-alanyl-D-glutamate--2,6-diaminopimelate ligase [Clostridia bacterium]|nr:UDP-N-acetylmuramoyl-L-alanyl-D-glutamate--2,6-diaminopimelate ligase [Clostridia bacterium]
MKLRKILSEIKTIKTIGNLDLNILELKIDSNSVTKGSMFFCLSGRDFDGHEYVRQVENYGGVCVVTERELDTSLTQIIVEDTRKAMSEIASIFTHHAHKKMKIIGVTGTNGKTTTTHFTTSILTGAGIKCGLIGTLGVFYQNKFIEADLTTPDPIELHKIFLEMYESGVSVVVMEVSAHALELSKVYGIDFEIAVFTNLSQDHLDFFNDMQTYKNAKLKLFTCNKPKYSVINSDDSFGMEILSKCKNAVTFGLDNPADVFALNVVEDIKGSSFLLNLFDCIYDVKINLIGKFNVSNALAAASACALMGVKIDKVVEGLENLKGVSGRLEKVYDQNFSVFVDYAHTPDGLSKTLTTLKRVCKNKLICVFGCGGNRDKGKREIMGKISGEKADFTIITSDNPRFEEPMDIINQIENGILPLKKDYMIVQDRYEAIKYALSKAKKDDLIVICGKGCERFQEVYGIKNLFNDKDTVIELTRRK